MGYTSKVDVIDLIINVLKDHESSLDDLVNSLEKINRDIEESLNEKSFLISKEKDVSKDKLKLKITDLEKKLEKYKNTINSVLMHCEKINDVVCLRLVAQETIK